ncbi:FG-GAP repeat protein [Oceanispirochaeta sp. M1]|nr:MULTISPECIES: FG-GAP repeat protein [unclassified Oceanispirochaeta]
MDKLIASDGAASDNFGRSVSHFQDKGGISVHP